MDGLPGRPGSRLIRDSLANETFDGETFGRDVVLGPRVVGAAGGDPFEDGEPASAVAKGLSGVPQRFVSVGDDPPDRGEKAPIRRILGVDAGQILENGDPLFPSVDGLVHPPLAGQEVGQVEAGRGQVALKGDVPGGVKDDLAEAVSGGLRQGRCLVEPAECLIDDAQVEASPRDVAMMKDYRALLGGQEGLVQSQCLG